MVARGSWLPPCLISPVSEVRVLPPPPLNQDLPGAGFLRCEVEPSCRRGRTGVTGIGALPGAEIGWTPRVNQGLVRSPDSRPGATNAHHDRRTAAVIAAIRETREAFFGGTTWRGKRSMRVSVCNWQTTDADVDRAVAAVRHALGT